MYRILVAECEQQVSSFNPIPSQYEDFEIHQGSDLIAVNSPGAHARYFTWAAKNFSVDVPGATSANLTGLPYRHCRRPMYPLDPDMTFTPQVALFGP